MKVSIIIAAYNVEKYINRCIDSCLSQNYDDLEIIVVNDGSTDNTEEILDKILDERVKVINKNNEGVSKAREVGFNISTGDYVLFVDADDWLDKNLLLETKQYLETEKYDILMFNYNFAYEDNRIIENKLVLKSNDFLLNVLTEPIPYLWMKFIRRDFIIKNKISMVKEINYAEDLAFSAKLAIYKPKVKYLDKKLYFYYQRIDSVTKKCNSTILDVKKSTDLIEKLLIENRMYDNYKHELDFCIY
ncbi:glycosyltransferase, partial [Clostridium perfringens]|nr:glycosyltransferase [Clostridium perfringens]